MITSVPGVFKNTKTVRQIFAYMDTVFDKVLHTTLNPDGPGAIRIHLIPPKRAENALFLSLLDENCPRGYNRYVMRE